MEKQENDIHVTTKHAFHALGIKWEGTFVEAANGSIRTIQQDVKRRLHEIPHIVHPETLLGLSYLAVPDGSGFTHYSAVEVESVNQLPDGMMSISLPTLTYITYNHHKGQVIRESYNKVYDWIKRHHYEENNLNQLTPFEQYPMKQDPFDPDPEFMIMIPVKKVNLL
ncbi:GyrI-like domain-containing protein [Pseudogracilibacillus auburnensis]|uniref:GyrI-like domain-containing protein n=1 Tax=Pseudogracilibacillus auburnensis TaxID=1494959 RepID=UPI001A972BFE|nr:GyrI-like domain-containing protein [Pseudogracilibacillus auburnensis]MBO1003334.1 GyrI-like domain-containing protein [Pseudogracilibacillus auburnensis]